MSRTIHRPLSPLVLFPILLAALLALGPVPAGAQGLGGLAPGSGSGESSESASVDYQEAVRAATVSFREKALSIAEEQTGAVTDLDGARISQLEELAEARARAFSREAERALLEKMGDGFLSEDEARRALEELRAAYTAELREDLSALAAGYPLPPRRDGETGVFQHFLAMTEYTLARRNGLENWGLLLLFVIVGLVGAEFLTRLVGRIILRLKDYRESFVGQLLSMIRGPLFVLAATGGVLFGLQYIWMPPGAREVIFGIVKLVMAIALFWLLWNVSGAAARLIQRSKVKDFAQIDQQVVSATEKIFRLAALFIFVIFVAELFFDTDLAGVLTGLGLLGLAVTLAAQDSLRNLLGSFTVYADRPFRVDDIVIIAGEVGTIEEIGFRSSRIRRFDGHQIIVPNTEIVNSKVENISRRPSIRRRFAVRLPLNTPPDKAQKAVEIIRDVLKDYEGKPEGQDPNAYLDEFGEYFLNILVQYYFTPPDYWQAKAWDEKFNLEVIRRFREEGIRLAEPARRLFHDADNDNMREFVLLDEDHEEHSSRGNGRRQKRTKAGGTASEDEDSEQ